MNWVLVGYTAKRRALRDGWISPWESYPDIGFPCSAPVEEICSVSNCIARTAESLETLSTGNPLGLCSSPALAWSAVPWERQGDFALYGYKLWPVQFEDGQDEGINLWWELEVQPLPDSFVSLGWDVVQGGNGHSFGCSPMSCNSGADIVRCPDINRYCLVANAQAALALARNFSISKPEPGPYCVVEVFRDIGHLQNVRPVA